MTRLDVALEYASKSWPVIPLHTPTGDTHNPCSCNNRICPDAGKHLCHKQTCPQAGMHFCHQTGCSNIGKHPRVMNGLKDAATDETTIRKWWEMWPAANIGIVTGAKSGFIVLDVDPKNGGDKTLDSLIEKHGKFAEKVCAKTGGGGWHIFFEHPGYRVANTQGAIDRPSYLGLGLDLRGDDGYIVAPGSVHASGSSYEWKIEKNGHWPKMPDWLSNLIHGRNVITGVSRSPSSSILTDEPELNAGARHPQLLRWAAQMRHHGLSGDAILAALRIENQTRCNPPKEDNEIVDIAKWVAGRQPSEALAAVIEEVEEDEADTGLKTLDDYEKELDELYEHGFSKGLHPGWDCLADIWTIEQGQTVLVTGAPTAGKSTFVNAWMSHMSMGYDWITTFCSPEFHPVKYHILRYIETYQGEPVSNLSNRPKMRRDVYEEAKKWVKAHVCFAEPEKRQKRTLDFAMNVAQRAQDKMGCNALVIDPFASFFHSKNKGQRDDEWLAEQINILVDFGHRTKITPVVVVHPHQLMPNKEGKYEVVKPYDLNGGAMWFNLFHHVLSLHRDKSWADGLVELYVWKCKYQWLGRQGKVQLYYDAPTGRYKEILHGETLPWYLKDKSENKNGRRLASIDSYREDDIIDF